MMNNRENIGRWEAMTEEELISLAEASDIEVPGELSEKLDTLIKRLDAEERHDLKAQKVRRTKIYSFSAFGLVAASIAVAIFLRTQVLQPKDTFSSPEEAYAMLESTLSHIASKTGDATLTLSASVYRVEETINDIYR